MPIASVFRPVLLFIGSLLAAVLPLAALGQEVGSTAADGFNPNVNGTVYAIAVQPDGKVLVAGSFTAIQPPGVTQPIAKKNITRLYPDGRNDPTFNAEVEGQISALLLEPDGQVLIGGKFTTVNGTTRRRVARLNTDGSLDAGFDPNIEPRSIADGGSLTPEVTCLLLQPDGKVVVGGGFKAVQPNGATALTLRNRLARFHPDGSLDAQFDPSANNMVLALGLQTDGKILVGGGFTTLQPNGASATVSKIRMARLNADGSLDTSFDPRPNNAVSAIQVLPDGDVVIGGSFTTIQPNGGDELTTGAVRITRLNSDGTFHSGFGGNADGPVSVIALQPDGGMLVGGSFATLGSGSASYVGRLLPSGTLDATFLPGPNYAVYAIAVQPNGSVLLGGGFLTLRGQGKASVVRNHLARVSFRGALDTDFRPDVNGRLRSLIPLSDGKMLVGGSFTSVAGATHNGVVRLNANGTVDSSFKADANGPIIAAVQLSNGQIIVGGAFTQINSTARSYLARLNADGSVDPNYDPAPNGQVNTLALQSDGKLIVGGSFTQLSPFSTTEPVSRNYLARINADGTLDLTYSAQANDIVNVIVAQADGKLLVGGSFSTVLADDATSTTVRYGIARFNSDGTLDTGFNPNVNGTIYAIAVQSDNKVIFAGSFAELAPNSATESTVRHNVARVNADGTLDTTFDPNPDNVVVSVLVQPDGRVLLGGSFDVLRANGDTTGQERHYVARVESSGVVDQSFNLYLDTIAGNQVVGLAWAGEGKIVIVGAFAQVGVNGVQRSRIARVNADGSPDESFNSDLSSMGGANIRALTQQFSGHVLVAGEFGGLGGTGGTNMARFFADSSPDTAFVPSFDGPVHALVEAPQKGISISTQRGGFAWLASNGTLRPGVTFGSEIEAMTSIRAVAVQSDGKILVAATYTISDADSSLARFNPDGSLDSTFQRTTSGTISAIRILSDGKILIGGEFTKVGDVARTNFARLNADGTLDTSFVVSASDDVLAITLQGDGKILLAGNFTSVTASGAASATTRNGIARLNADGTMDTAFDPNPNSSVQVVIVQPDNKIIIGGGFTGLYPNGSTTLVEQTFLTRLNPDGTVDTTVDLDVNGFVGTAGVQADGKIVVGGYFTSMGGQTRNRLARVNADMTLDETFNPNANGAVSAVAVQPDGKILVAGLFTALQPGGSTYNAALATPRNRIARLNADGTVDPLFNPNLDAQATTVTPYTDGSVIVTGGFTTLQPTGSLMIGGAFTSINGVPVKNLAIFGNDGSVSAAFQPSPNGAVHALLSVADGHTIVGGAFTQIAGAARGRIARFDEEDNLDPAFNPNADGDVAALALEPDGDVLVGGSFTTIGGSGRRYLARIRADGSLDSSFAPTVPGAVSGIALQADGRILVLSAGSGVRSVLLRLLPNGDTDSSFTAVNGGADAINSFAVQTDGRIVVGGAFTSLAGGARSYLARLNSNGTLDASLTSSPNQEVTAVLVQRDGKILIGGRFTAVDGLPRFGIARVATSTSNTGSSAFVVSDDRTAVTWVRAGVGPEISSAYFETSTDLSTWTMLGQATRVPNSTNWRVSNVTLPADPVYVRASAIVPSTPNSSAGLTEAQGRLTTAAPSITSATVVSTAADTNFVYAIAAAGAPTSYFASGLPAGLSINTATGVISGTPTQAGSYNVVLSATNASGTSSLRLTLIVGVRSAGKVTGSAIDAGANIRHPNGNIIDQFLLTGTSVSLTADPGEVTRVSFIDLDDDIVQVEFSGAGTLTLMLTAASGPAAPVNYVQPGINYMKGHASVVVTDANETTNLAVFSVGRANAVDQSLFREDATYDGLADLAYISIASTNGRFGALRGGNAVFFSGSGITGVYAPEVQFAGPVYLGDISAFDTAASVLVLGANAGETLIAGGDLLQANAEPVIIDGISRLKFVNGTTSHGLVLPAQPNRAVLEQDGVDVTNSVVVSP